MEGDCCGWDLDQLPALEERALEAAREDDSLALMELLEGATRLAFGDALVAAAEAGHQECVRLLLEHVDGFVACAALAQAALHGHRPAVKLLLDCAPDWLTRNEMVNGTALVEAAAGGHKDVVLLLLASGAAADVEELLLGPLG